MAVIKKFRIKSFKKQKPIVSLKKISLSFGKRQILDNINFEANIPDWDDKGTVLNEEMILVTQSKKELQSIMSNYVGIVRSDRRLKRALARLKILYDETEVLYENSIVSPQLCELRNLICIGYIIIKFCITRKECVGAHYNIDYLN